MKNKGILAIGGALALGMIKKGLAGSGNQSYSSSCNSCQAQDMTLKEMFETVKDCSYNLPDINDLKADLKDSKSPGFGSFNKDWDKYVTQMSQYLTQEELTSITNLIEYIDDSNDTRTLGVIKELLSRLSGNYPNQIRILLDMGITTVSPKVDAEGEFISYLYPTAKEIAKTITVVGYSIFMTRYLQQISFYIDDAEIPRINAQFNNVYSDDKAWKIDWVCSQKANFPNNHKMAFQNLQKILADEFNLYVESRRFLNKTTSEGAVTDEELSPTEALMKISDIAWYMEMARSCGYGKNQPLFHTYPMEKLANVKGTNTRSIFEYLDYKIVVPSKQGSDLREAFPDTYSKFKNRINQLGNDNNLFEITDKPLRSPRIQYINPKTGNKCSVLHFSLTQAYIHSESLGVFTHTSKMNTISFSIPAGQPGSGGSCTVAGMNVSVPGIGVGDINFICNSCYALAGKYQMVKHILTNAPRMNWLSKIISSGKDVTTNMPVGNQEMPVKHKDPTDIALLLSLCIESYARYGSGDKREDMEIGVASEGKLIYFTQDMKKKSIPSVVLAKTQKSSQSYFGLEYKKNQDKVAGYFRIHDSGDFSISSKAGIRYGYILAWRMIAECFGNVKFWAPTRIWTTGYEQVDSQRQYVSEMISQYSNIQGASKQQQGIMQNLRMQLQETEMRYGKTGPVQKGLIGFRRWLESDSRASSPEGKDKGFKNRIRITTNSIAKALAAKEIMGLSVEEFAKNYVFGPNSRAFREWKTTLDSEKNGVYMSAPKDLVVMDFACNTATKNMVVRPSGLTSVNPFTAPFFPIPMLSKKEVIVRMNGPKLFRASHMSAGSGVNFVFSVAKGGKDFTDKAYEKLGVLETLKSKQATPQVKRAVKDRVRISMFNYARSIYGMKQNATVPKKIYTRLYDETGSVAYQCPVYKETNDKGQKIGYKDACMESKCRACWVLPDMSVTYGEH